MARIAVSADDQAFAEILSLLDVARDVTTTAKRRKDSSGFDHEEWQRISRILRAARMEITREREHSAQFRRNASKESARRRRTAQ